jgi:hypothetical protein
MIHARYVDVHFNAPAPGAVLSSVEAFAEPIVRTATPGAPAARFCAQGESVVDAKTGLMWSANDLPGERLTHAAAVAAVAAYRGDGYSDWRLPTREELLSLVDDTRSEPAIDTSVFPTCKSAYYWASSPWASSPDDYAWLVLFYYGYSDYGRRDNDAFVRAVRAVSPGQ